MTSDRRFTFTAYQLTIAAVIVIAAVVRLWSLGSVPIELHPDEIAPYVGVRDMLTGHRPFAIFIESDVIYLPLYGVFELISATLFGESAAALRLPAALCGIATVIGTGLLATTFVRNRIVFALAAGILAVVPWDVALTRVGWEPAATLPFLVFGLYALRRGLLEESGRAVIIGCAVLAVGAYSYRAAGFDAAALGALLIAFEYRRVAPVARPLAIGIAAALAIVAPFVLATLAHPDYLSSGPAQLTFKAGFNASSIGTFEQRYIAQFSPLALFVHGDGNLQHGPDAGVLYGWMAPFIAIGIFAPLRLLGRRDRLFLYAWLVLYPVGNAMVNEVKPQHFVRTLIGIPLFTIFAAIGCYVVWHWLRERVASERFRAVTLTVFAAVVAAQFAQFLSGYFGRYPGLSADAFQYGDRNIFAFVRAHAAGFDRFCFTAIGNWNWTTLTHYYMNETPLELHARIEAPCALPHTLFAVEKRTDAPANARLIGTVQKRDGTIRAYFLGT